MFDERFYPTVLSDKYLFSGRTCYFPVMTPIAESNRDSPIPNKSFTTDLQMAAKSNQLCSMQNCESILLIGASELGMMPSCSIHHAI